MVTWRLLHLRGCFVRLHGFALRLIQPCRRYGSRFAALRRALLCLAIHKRLGRPGFRFCGLRRQCGRRLRLAVRLRGRPIRCVGYMIGLLMHQRFCAPICRVGKFDVLLRCLRRCLLRRRFRLGAATLTAMLLRRPIGLDRLAELPASARPAAHPCALGCFRPSAVRRPHGHAAFAAFARLFCAPARVCPAIDSAVPKLPQSVRRPAARPPAPRDTQAARPPGFPLPRSAPAMRSLLAAGYPSVRTTHLLHELSD